MQGVKNAQHSLHQPWKRPHCNKHLQVPQVTRTRWHFNEPLKFALLQTPKIQYWNMQLLNRHVLLKATIIRNMYKMLSHTDTRDCTTPEPVTTIPQGDTQKCTAMATESTVLPTRNNLILEPAAPIFQESYISAINAHGLNWYKEVVRRNIRIHILARRSWMRTVSGIVISESHRTEEDKSSIKLIEYEHTVNLRWTLINDYVDSTNAHRETYFSLFNWCAWISILLGGERGAGRIEQVVKAGSVGQGPLASL